MSASLLRTLFAEGRRHLAAAASVSPPVTIVLGNEACDADSAVAALAHALTLRSADSSHQVLPVVSCSRADFALRREADVIVRTWLGADALTSLDDGVVFLDELLASPASSSAAAAAGRSLELVLVDHNSLRGELAARGWGARVVGIVDHHRDEGGHAHVAGRARRVDYDDAARRGVGSACTLVALELLLAQPCALDAALARALLSVIALDTAGLNPAAGKTTPADERAAAALQARVAAGSGGGGSSDSERPCVRELFATLSALRSDARWLLSLPPRDVLGLDWKAFEVLCLNGDPALTIGTAAMALGVRDFLCGGAAHPCSARLRECFAFGAARGVDLLALLSAAPASGSGGSGGSGSAPAPGAAPWERQLALLPLSRAGARAADAVLRDAPLAAACALQELVLLAPGEPLPEGAAAPPRLFAHSPLMSRKQLVPAWSAILEAASREALDAKKDSPRGD